MMKTICILATSDLKIMRLTKAFVYYIFVTMMFGVDTLVFVFIIYHNLDSPVR